MSVNLQKIVDIAFTKEYIVEVDETAELGSVLMRTVDDGLIAKDALLNLVGLVDDLSCQFDVRIFQVVQRT